MRRRHREKEEPDHLIAELRAKQGNLTWPQTLISGRLVDLFLWRGSPSPTRSQRVGAWLLGVLFILQGVILLSFAKSERFWPGLLISWAFILLGAKVFRNGFARRRSTQRS